MRPRIGITCSFDADTRKNPPREKHYLNASYADAIFAAGGLPILLPVPPEPNTAVFDDLLASVDGLLFTGGDDLHPDHYGDPVHPEAGLMHARRNAFEVAFFRRADERRKPILAVCLGFQVAHVARGGKLIQHLDEIPREPLVAHRGEHWRGAFHRVRIEPDSRLAQIMGGPDQEVNSRHHQAANGEFQGRGLRPVAWSPDGLLEGSEDMNGRFLLAVQWHPEDLTDRPEHLKLFEALVGAARS